ncbi:MAG: hypothetical protein AW08_00345 [Candidatus Accumulibacter adjunctus]|uniref:Uncharacterized protein n=1 Tax=Candidatus Accumulibacter adjunctus TaxID=1454001 RepID=A0A011NYX6_9PROT|nr:MAG: hypothetical protein AW08_00345 [Candidatus Accumulibacter adjunctus]
MFKPTAAVFLSCLSFIVGCNVKPTVRQIAESIQIDKTWTEIHPSPPLVVSEQVQSISIKVPNLPDWDIRPETASFVQPDGTVVKIEVELVATGGTRFSLESVGLGPGLKFSPRPQSAAPDSSRLPQGMSFKTVRFRSDRPIQGGHVTWICITNY